MTGSNPEFDDRLLDRLVDGELSDSEYRQLLRELDAHPEGWRQCALAFLEGQALRREMAGLEQEMAMPPASPAAPRSRSWELAGWLTLASAASFLLAFFVASHLFREPEGGFRSGPLINQVAGNGSRSDNRATGPQMSHVVAATGGPAVEDTPWGQYQLVVDDANGRPQQIELPVFAPDDPRANLLMNDQATMPVELIRQLEQLGLQVDRQRHWTSVPPQASSNQLGVPVYVPVEELRITPVSSRSFQ